jgi:hypothetical protein
MLVGVVALNVLKVLARNDPRAVGVLLVGYFFQGIGSFITSVVCVFQLSTASTNRAYCLRFFYLNLYVLRVMTVSAKSL